MSATALCNAVVEQIKSVLTVPNKGWIEVCPTDEPPSSGVGDLFVSVFEEGWTYTGFTGDGGYTRNSGQGLHNAANEEYYISACVSVKVAANHKDFWGAQLNMPWDKSMDHAVRGILSAVHLQPDVLRLANQQIDTAVSSPVVEMLRAMSVSKKVKRGPEWWGTTTTATSKRVSEVIGYSRTIRFFGGKRIQGIGNYT